MKNEKQQQQQQHTNKQQNKEPSPTQLSLQVYMMKFEGEKLCLRINLLISEIKVAESGQIYFHDLLHVHLLSFNTSSTS